MDVIIISVTKRLNGVCIAGIGKYNTWVRPTKREELELKDIKINDKEYISVGNVYEFHFSSKAPIQCQSENYLIDDYREIKCKGTMPESERRKLFHQLSENSLVTSDQSNNIADILRAKNRSIVMFGPVRLQSVYLHAEENMKCPEISFSVDSVVVKGIQDKTNLQCTDLKFWQFARQLLKKNDTNSMTLDDTGIKKLLGYDKVFVIVGLTKLYHGKNWPMIIGLHMFPDYYQAIDYSDL
ncbi:MAG: hypothetical protein HGA85_03070 [Nanoarchaeota archaeon]|nr:hypothetical protein [Nanoarchaeota archaeon]